jgi:hypothetical protein
MAEAAMETEGPSLGSRGEVWNASSSLPGFGGVKRARLGISAGVPNAVIVGLFHTSRWPLVSFLLAFRLCRARFGLGAAHR